MHFSYLMRKKAVRGTRKTVVRKTGRSITGHGPWNKPCLGANEKTDSSVSSAASGGIAGLCSRGITNYSDLKGNWLGGGQGL